MTRGDKVFWFLFLCLTLGASIKLPTTRTTAVAQPPPNTNWYDAAMAWEFPDPSKPVPPYTRIYWGWSASNFLGSTQFMGNTGTLRLPASNSVPWLKAVGVDYDGTETAPLFFTVSNYMAVWWSVSSNLVNWQQDTNRKIVQTTKAHEFIRVGSSNFDNWGKVP